MEPASVASALSQARAMSDVVLHPQAAVSQAFGVIVAVQV